ncbi:hypothetical protein BHM03_00039274 [Ensete ventricosum]|nr:hypothetical protein BHM03_00039274 [Ensete ventricosum]
MAVRAGWFGVIVLPPAQVTWLGRARSARIPPPHPTTAWTGYGRVSRRTTDLTKVRRARSTCPSCRKDDARLAARTTDSMVKCGDMVSDGEDKGLKYERPVMVTIKAHAPLRSRGIANRQLN